MKIINKVNYLISNVPYKFIGSDIYEINELCEGYIKTLNKQIIKPKLVNINYDIINNKIKCNINKFNIPVEKASASKLAYYNCMLIKQNDIFILNNSNKKILPYIEMIINNNIINNDMKYLSYIHMEYEKSNYYYSPSSRSSYGQLILGKKYNNMIEMTGFTIPYGNAILIPNNTPYNDELLFGFWNIVHDNYKIMI